MRPIYCLIVFLTASLSLGQVGVKDKSPTAVSIVARTHVDVDVVDTPDSIEELLVLAPLVVSGIVDSSKLPARPSDPANPNSVVESDVVFLVSSVIKGHLLDSQKTFKRLVVCQIGGLYKGRLVVPSGESLLEQGENYILFLAPDPRKGRPNVADLPRYYVVGVWSGKFRIEKLGGLQASPKAGLGLRAHNSESPDAFIAEVLAAILRNPALGH